MTPRQNRAIETLLCFKPFLKITRELYDSDHEIAHALGAFLWFKFEDWEGRTIADFIWHARTKA